MDFTQAEIIKLSRIKKERAALQLEWDKLAEGIGASVVHPDLADRVRLATIVEADGILAEQRQEIIIACRNRMAAQSG